MRRDLNYTHDLRGGHQPLPLLFWFVIPVGNLRSGPEWYPSVMPSREYHFWVYILSNRSHTLYIGLTNNLRARVEQHRQLVPGTHTAKYQVGRLVYYEYYRYIRNAIAREKELKHWTRAQKIALIESVNPTWEELFVE